MSDSFSLSSSRGAATSDAALREEITDHTGSASATAGILRSLERFGGDPSIERYEITRKKSGRYAASQSSAGWNVRAVRAGDRDGS